MEPDNCSHQLDYTRLLFNKKSRTNCKVNNNNNNTHGAITTTTTTTNISECQEALELLKTILTSQFENEILQTVDKYMEVFRRAASNIEFNQGQHIPQNMLNAVLQGMLKKTRQAVTRRYGQFLTGRTLKIHKRKARTLENQRKAWLKQIRSKNCISEGVAEESGSLECTEQPAASVEQLTVDVTADSKCD